MDRSRRDVYSKPTFVTRCLLAILVCTLELGLKLKKVSAFLILTYFLGHVESVPEGRHYRHKTR
jgi:hypothetical protein